MEYCSTRLAARALGVSESTIRRWVDRGVLPSQKTSGGHRRIRVADLVVYAREHGLASAQPEALHPSDADHTLEESIALLSHAMGAGDADSAGEIAVGFLLGGMPLPEVLDALIAPAMVKVGELWTGGFEGILAEHRATSVTLGLVERLGQFTPRHSGLGAIGGAVAGDPYSIPSAMSKEVMRQAGYDAFDLGPNTPVRIIGQALQEREGTLAWISANHVSDPVTTRADILRVAETCKMVGASLVVGGRGTALLNLPDLPGLHTACSMGELHQIATDAAATVPQAPA